MSAIHKTQKTFRTVLDAMSKPGKIVKLEDDGEITTNHIVALSLLTTTFMDHETRFCCLGTDRDSLTSDIYTQTKSEISTVENADFIIINGGTSDNLILKAKPGSAEYPDQNATLIYLVDGFGKSVNALTIEMEGPGIKDTKMVNIEGVEKSEIVNIIQINKSFPLGLDSIFLDNNGQVMCIPRSTKISWGI